MSAGPTKLECVAATIVNHIERCREEIATAEEMLEVLRSRHDIVASTSPDLVPGASILEALQLAIEKVSLAPGDILVAGSSRPDLSMNEQAVLRARILDAPPGGPY